MYQLLKSWPHQNDNGARSSRLRKDSSSAFVLSVLAVIGLYLIGFGLLGHTFRLLWLADESSARSVYWSGWKDIEFIFAFGDSYTTTSFDVHGVQPTPKNPLGNMNGGWPYGTQVNTSNYIQYLTFKYNESLILTYNFAWAGGTIDNRIDQSPFGSVDFHEQVQNQFTPHFGKEQRFRSWNANNSMFVSFFGINDIALFKTKPNASDYITLVVQSYENSTETLYDNGARNFLFINVPAVERSPGALKSKNPQQEAASIRGLNNALHKFVKGFAARHVDTAAFYLDAHALTTKVLDDPKSYPITSVIRNTTGYCKPYERSSELNLFDPSCGIPRNEYFWADHLHPTSTVHDIIADRIVMDALRKPL